MKVAKHLTVRQANKLPQFIDPKLFPLGITYPDGKIPTPGTWMTTLAKKWEAMFGCLDDDGLKPEFKP
jgi:hypothetical protein